MKYVKTITYIINALCALALFVCAYSEYLYPVNFPNWSYLGLLLPVPLALNIFFVVFWLFIRRRYTILSLAVMLLCAPQIRTWCPFNPFQDEPNLNSIKILSYNVMHFNRENTTEKWEDNEILNYILESNADIVCLQEAKVYDKSSFLPLLKTKYDYVYRTSVADTSMCIASRLPVVDTLSIDISDYSNQCFVAKILLGKDTLTLLNNHLESYKLSLEDREKYKDIFRDLARQQNRYEIETNFDYLEGKLASANQIRAIQADIIDDYVSHCNSKYIISCGDFNDCSISYVHRKMASHLNDAYTQSGNGPGLSYHHSGMHFRIDNILVSDTFRPYGATVDKSINLSDHYPIFCTLYY